MSKIIIRPTESGASYWMELWRYRELFLLLSWRDFAVRYKQTAIGVSWAVLRPLLTMLVFTVVFGYFAKMPSGAVPYAILVSAALLPWQFFSNAVAEASSSLINNTNLITKVYFPRLVVPVSSVMVSAVDFIISLSILAVVFAWYQFMPSWRIVFVPVFTIVAFISALGGGLLIAALNVKYRDFRYVVPFLVQIGLYVSPVGYSSSAVPEAFRLLYSLNPMVGVIDCFRWAICNEPFYWPSATLALVVSFSLLSQGVWYFRNVERSFADSI
jgi:lipopolysaccharide transport system permease protein